jgi:hypothetical protein
MFPDKKPNKDCLFFIFLQDKIPELYSLIINFVYPKYLSVPSNNTSRLKPLNNWPCMPHFIIILFQLSSYNPVKLNSILSHQKTSITSTHKKQK